MRHEQCLVTKLEREQQSYDKAKKGEHTTTD
jgi:hypothetical protein